MPAESVPAPANPAICWVLVHNWGRERKVLTVTLTDWEGAWPAGEAGFDGGGGRIRLKVLSVPSQQANRLALAGDWRLILSAGPSCLRGSFEAAQ